MEFTLIYRQMTSRYSIVNRTRAPLRPPTCSNSAIPEKGLMDDS